MSSGRLSWPAATAVCGATALHGQVVLSTRPLSNATVACGSSGVRCHRATWAGGAINLFAFERNGRLRLERCAVPPRSIGRWCYQLVRYRTQRSPLAPGWDKPQPLPFSPVTSSRSPESQFLFPGPWPRSLTPRIEHPLHCIDLGLLTEHYVLGQADNAFVIGEVDHR